MRVVNSEAELLPASEVAQTEAKKAFSNGDVYIEKYIERPRHIEFQSVADSKGRVIYLPERECSIQRRHQKLIEESPSPFVDSSLRRKMGKAARRDRKSTR